MAYMCCRRTKKRRQQMNKTTKSIVKNTVSGALDAKAMRADAKSAAIVRVPYWTRFVLSDPCPPPHLAIIPLAIAAGHVVAAGIAGTAIGTACVVAAPVAVAIGAGYVISKTWSAIWD